jgi:hypothetical protein
MYSDLRTIIGKLVAAFTLYLVGGQDFKFQTELPGAGAGTDTKYKVIGAPSLDLDVSYMKKNHDKFLQPGVLEYTESGTTKYLVAFITTDVSDQIVQIMCIDNLPVYSDPTVNPAANSIKTQWASFQKATKVLSFHYPNGAKIKMANLEGQIKEWYLDNKQKHLFDEHKKKVNAPAFNTIQPTMQPLPTLNAVPAPVAPAAVPAVPVAVPAAPVYTLSKKGKPFKNNVEIPIASTKRLPTPPSSPLTTNGIPLSYKGNQYALYKTSPVPPMQPVHYLKVTVPTNVDTWFQLP